MPKKMKMKNPKKKKKLLNKLTIELEVKFHLITFLLQMKNPEMKMNHHLMGFQKWKTMIPKLNQMKN